jgi:hypothetical protein
MIRLSGRNKAKRGETMTSKKYLTPPELGKLWGVGGDKVLALIHSGPLRAVNLAVNGTGRPRFESPNPRYVVSRKRAHLSRPYQR